MNQKFLVVLFFTILYNGVTFSSPANFSDTISKEEELSGILSGAKSIKQKLEPSSVVTSANNSVPVIQSTPSVLHHSEISTAQNATVNFNSTNGNAVMNSSAEIVKNGSQDSVSQNVSKVADNKTSSQAVDIKTATSLDYASADQSSTSVNLSSTSTSTTSTTAIPVNTELKPNVSTVAPTPASTNKVVTGQNTSAPVEEKHFDGPSFIGGIVLTVGLTAIGFIAFKFYKSGKIDMNYRTL